MLGGIMAGIGRRWRDYSGTDTTRLSHVSCQFVSACGGGERTGAGRQPSRRIRVFAAAIVSNPVAARRIRGDATAGISAKPSRERGRRLGVFGLVCDDPANTYGSEGYRNWPFGSEESRLR